MMKSMRMSECERVGVCVCVCVSVCERESEREREKESSSIGPNFFVCDVSCSHFHFISFVVCSFHACIIYFFSPNHSLLD